MENEQRLCDVCGKNETGRYWDGAGGFEEKKAVCGKCLVSGRWRELLPPEPEAKALDTEASVLPDGFEAVGDGSAEGLGITISEPESISDVTGWPSEPEPKPHKHFYRKDGTCTCGKKRKAKK